MAAACGAVTAFIVRTETTVAARQTVSLSAAIGPPKTHILNVFQSGIIATNRAAVNACTYYRILII
jgi:hypothetical protein